MFINGLHPHSLRTYIYQIIRQPQELESFLQPIFNRHSSLLAFEVLTRLHSRHIPLATLFQFLVEQQDYEILRHFQNCILEQSLINLPSTRSFFWLNLTPICYHHFDYIYQLIHIINRYAEPQQIAIEVHESWINWCDINTLIDCLRILRSWGITIVFDDVDLFFFETQMYHRINTDLVQYIKLSLPFVHRLVAGWDAGFLHLEELIKRGWSIVAEGVENERIWQYLLSHKLIDYYQGYWLGVPFKVIKWDDLSHLNYKVQ